MREIVERREVVELLELGGDRIRNLVARMTDVCAPQTTDAVDKAVAIGIVHMGAVSLDDSAMSPSRGQFTTDASPKSSGHPKNLTKTSTQSNKREQTEQTGHPQLEWN